MEVHRMMREYRCGVEEACRRIAEGGRKNKILIGQAKSGAKRYTVSSPWKGENSKTLARRYWNWLNSERERQKKSTA
jgi:hypothetical protein